MKALLSTILLAMITTGCAQAPVATQTPVGTQAPAGTQTTGGTHSMNDADRRLLDAQLAQAIAHNQQTHEFWKLRVELAGIVWHYEAPYATYKLCVFEKENEGPNWPNKLCARLDKQLDRATTQTSAQKKAWKEAK
jgi:hypothetical protein